MTGQFGLLVLQLHKAQNLCHMNALLSNNTRGPGHKLECVQFLKHEHFKEYIQLGLLALQLKLYEEHLRILKNSQEVREALLLCS